MIPEQRDTNQSGPRERLAYPLPEAAELLGGITERKLRMMIANKEIGAMSIGSRRFITKAEIERYVAQQAAAGAVAA